MLIARLPNAVATYLQVGAAIKALSQQIKTSGADVGIGVATMLGFEDTVKLFRVRAFASVLTSRSREAEVAASSRLR